MSTAGSPSTPPNPKATIVAEWVSVARGDWDLALREHAYTGIRNLRAIGFHAQQAIEKLMKAVLIDRNTNPPKTHDLEVLDKMLQGGGTPSGASLLDLARLTSAAVATRYPGPSLTPTDVDDLMIIASAIWTRLRPLV